MKQRAVPAMMALAIVFFAALPLFADAYKISFFLLIFMYLTLAGSWNIITGYAGYLALGHAAFKAQRIRKRIPSFRHFCMVALGLPA